MDAKLRSLWFDAGSGWAFLGLVSNPSGQVRLTDDGASRPTTSPTWRPKRARREVRSRKQRYCHKTYLELVAFVSVLVSFVVVRTGSATTADGWLSTGRTTTTVAELWFAELESVCG
jgi:hypothetical protein